MRLSPSSLCVSGTPNRQSPSESHSPAATQDLRSAGQVPAADYRSAESDSRSAAAIAGNRQRDNTNTTQSKYRTSLSRSRAAKDSPTKSENDAQACPAADARS